MKLSYKEAQQLLLPYGFKALDCRRKAVLTLPAGALKVWLCYWMAEDEERESWMSYPEMRLQIGMDEETIAKWTHWLLRNKWLVDTGKCAADKLRELGKRPSVGSNAVRVYCVDDPITPKNSGGKIPEGGTYQEREVRDKVYGYGSISSSSSSSSDSYSANSNQSQLGAAEPYGGTGTGKPQPQNPNTKPTRAPKSAPDGTPYPPGFNTWQNVKRTEWLVTHGLPRTKPSSPQSGMDASAGAIDEKPKPRKLTRAQQAAADDLSLRQTQMMLDSGLGMDLESDPEIGPCDNAGRCHNWAAYYDPEKGTRLCESCAAAKQRPIESFPDDEEEA